MLRGKVLSYLKRKLTGGNAMKKNAVSRDMAIVALEQRAHFYTGVSPVCALCEVTGLLHLAQIKSE